MSLMIYASTIVPALFAAGRQYVSVRDLKKVTTELYAAFGEIQSAMKLEHVYIDIDRNAISDLNHHHGYCCSQHDGIFFRTEGQLPHIFTREYVEGIFTWQVPEELRVAFWKVIESHAVDSLSETAEILKERIDQNIGFAKTYCKYCGENLPLLLDDESKLYKHLSGKGYSWQNQIDCRAQPERKREDELKKTLEQMKV